MISTRVLLHTQPDDVLAALAATGSEPAFETLVRRHRRALVAYSRRLVRTDAVAEDVVQQALLAAWRSLTAGTDVQDVRAWLYRITHNQAMTALRRSGPDDAVLTDVVAAALPIDNDLDARLRAGETLAAVAALPQLQRQAIVLTALDGNSQHDAAIALGVSDGAVRGLVYRARAALRSRLAAAIPAPAILWAAARTRAAVGTGLGAGGGSSEMVVAGGSAGGVAVAVKAAAVIASSAVVVGGTVGGAIDRSRPVSPRTRSAHASAVARPVAAATAATGPATGSVTTARAAATAGALRSTGAIAGTGVSGVSLTRAVPRPWPAGHRGFTATPSRAPLRRDAALRPAPRTSPPASGAQSSGSAGGQTPSGAPAGRPGTPEGAAGA